MIRSLRSTRRLFRIALIMAREDALFILDELGVPLSISWPAKLFVCRKPGKRRGQRLAAAFERLGPTFIKLGQALSTRSDLIGDDVAEDLAGLRDKLPPFPTSVARATIEAELQAPIATLFAAFDDIPVAAASIAQVHKAITKTGRQVAVKILRPGIEEAFARDLDLFAWIAEIADRKLASSKRLKPLEVVKTLRESVFFELDLRFEAAAADEMARNVAKHEAGLRIPGIDWQLTSRRVLTLEWVDGTAFSDMAAIRASGFNLDELLAKAARSLFSQVFVDGFFHADLHPGNLFLDKSGNLVAVDFGIMGRLDMDSRLYIAQILHGFMTEDYRHVAQIHFDAGYVPADKSIDAFTQACMAVARPIMDKPLSEISVAKLLGQMFKIASEFEMETQPQLLLMQKTMMVAEGVGRMLNPNLNMWELARPMIEEWANQHFSPQAKLKKAAEDGLQIARKLPRMLSHIEQALLLFGDKDGLKLHPQTLAQLRQPTRQSWLALGWAALVVATVFSAVLLLR